MALLVGIAYVITGKAGLSLAFAHPSASAVWPPTGIAIAAFLLLGYRVAPFIFAGAFLVNYTTEGTALTSLLIAFGNTLEGYTGAWLAQRFCGGKKCFESVRGVLLFTLLVALISTFVSPLVGVTTLALAGSAPWKEFGSIFLNWWLGDVAGALLVAPLILLWAQPDEFLWTPKHQVEYVLLLLALLATSLLSFHGAFPFFPVHAPLAFTTIPVVFWAALRFSPRHTATIVFLLSALTIAGTLRGYGSFSLYEPAVSLIYLQSFVGVTAFTNFCFAAIVKMQHGLMRTVSDNERRFRWLIENSADAIMLLDTRGIITYASPAIKRILGFRNNQYVGKNVFSFLHPEDVTGAERLFAKVLQHANTTVSTEVRHAHADGGWRWIEGSATNRLGESSVRKIVCNFRDITERREQEKRKRDLLSLIAHQLRTPTAEIKGLAENLLTGVHGRLLPAQREYIVDIQRISEDSFRLVQNLLNVSRIARSIVPVRLRKVPLNPLLRSIVEKYSERAKGKGIRMTMHPAKNFYVKADVEMLNAAVGNILDNAVKFTEKGEVSIKLTTDSTSVHIAIRDTGRGMSKGEMQNLFQKERVFSGPPLSGGGAHLGLYIAKEFMRLQRGDISVRSVQRKGSTLTLSLPLVRVH